MALTWDLGEIANWKTTCRLDVRTNDEGEEVWTLNPLTDALIWSTMGVGIGKITEDNYEEFYRRMCALAKIHGPMLRNAEGPRGITLAEVRAHIGLTCNVSFQHDLEFQMGLGRRVNEDASAALRTAKEGEQEPVEASGE